MLGQITRSIVIVHFQQKRKGCLGFKLSYIPESVRKFSIIFLSFQCYSTVVFSILTDVDDQFFHFFN